MSTHCHECHESLDFCAVWRSGHNPGARYHVECLAKRNQNFLDFHGFTLCKDSPSEEDWWRCVHLLVPDPIDNNFLSSQWFELKEDSKFFPIVAVKYDEATGYGKQFDVWEILKEVGNYNET